MLLLTWLSGCGLLLGGIGDDPPRDGGAPDAATSDAVTADAPDAVVPADGGTITPSGCVVAIALVAGADHTCAYDALGRVSCWGRNDVGQIDGVPSDPHWTPHATAPPDAHEWTGLVAASRDVSCVLSTTGALACWGGNDDGQLGLGSTATFGGIQWVTGLAGAEIQSLSGGYSHTCATTVDGRLFCWGDNGSGELGVGDTTRRTTPTLVAEPESGEWRSVGAGNDVTCAVGSRSAWCWGDGGFGQLGPNGSLTADSPTPVRVPDPPAGTWVSIDAGCGHTCGLTSEGEIWCFGNQDNGQLANGFTSSNDSPHPEPALVPGGPWATLSVGGDHNCALKADGSLYCWGDSSAGRIALPGNAVATPTRIDGIYRAVAAGERSTCVIALDGAVLCTGDNALSQAGGPAGSDPYFTFTPVCIQP